jgi:hypothetical protein
MDRSEAYDAAQRRMQERERKQRTFYAWLAVLIVIIALSALGGAGMFSCLLPLTLIAALVTAVQFVQLYYRSPQRVLSRRLIEEEMSWLYGDDWSSTTSQAEYTFAKERILKRRIGRWMFVFHVLVFIPINGSILSLASTYRRIAEPLSIFLYVMAGIWGLLLLRHAWQAFPTAGALARREPKAIEALELEIEALHLDKEKRGEKAKRKTRVVLSDDGELIELPETTDGLEEKSKREID